MALQAPSPTGRVPAREHAPRAVVPLRIWILALAAAESVGMLAAAAAARTVTSVFGETPRGADALGALGVLVAGGLVEATGLAIATALLLGRHLPGLRRRRLAAVTVLVGATGWALGSVPGVLASTGGGGSAPPWWWVLGAGALLGASTGALLGGSQSLVLRRLVPHPVRWALASAAGWTAAMAIIMVAATAPDAATPTVAVLGTAAAAGAVAGAVLGAVLGTAALTVDGATFTSTVVAQLLRGPARAVLGHHLVVLRVRGSASGRLREVPVSVAGDREGWVVLVSHAERKRWWRNLRRPAPVEVLHRGVWWSTTGEVLRPDGPEARWARTTYLRTHPRTRLDDVDVLVRLRRP